MTQAPGAQTTPQTITIDGTSYALADLSEPARAELASVRETDRRIAEAENTLKILRAAREMYGQRLKAHLPAEGTA